MLAIRQCLSCHFRARAFPRNPCASLPQGQDVPEASLGPWAGLNRSAAASPCPLEGEIRHSAYTRPDRIRCPALITVFPRKRCERAASGISPDSKKNFFKSVFHTKATPFVGRTIFGQVFVRK